MHASVRRRFRQDSQQLLILDMDQMKNSFNLQQQYINSRKGYIDPEEKLNWWWSIPIILIVSIVIGLPFIAFYALPEPINDGNQTDVFIASRAKADLQEFVDIGPKVVGDPANEVLTVQYLLRKLDQIQKESMGLYDIEIDVQEDSGGFVRDSFTNLYEGIQNVVVKLTPKNSTNQRSVLVNSHFDSVPDSPGAGDDGCMVVVMLGVLSTLTKSKNVLRRPVIFLFNGAEENGLQGSHMFITKHKWKDGVAAFLNLDATGTGGKEILFQTGPNSPWIVDLYAKAAKYPYASVIGEEIFENELIPSDTDFRIFRDYGHVPGLDLAYAYNDYVYHTRYDDIDIIEDGTYQHTGENVLGIVRAMADADELDQKHDERSDGKAVFFDVFGIFMVSYTETTSIVVNVVISIVALATIGLSTWLMQRFAAASRSEILKQFGITFGIQLVSLLLAIGVVLFMAFFVDAVNYSLAWFSESWLIFGIYFVPFIFILGIVPARFLGLKRYNSLPLRFRITLFLHSHCVILVLLVIVLTGMSLRTAFFINQCVLFYTIALLINILSKWYQRNHLWIVPILVAQLIPISYVVYIMIITFNLFIPINGRSGAKNNPEFMIALFSIIYAFLIFGFIIPINGIFRKSKTLISSLLVVWLVFFILMFTGVCFPYREKTSPQRQALLHTKRVMYDFNGQVRKLDSGFYAITWDRQTEYTLNEVTEKMNLRKREANEDCGIELFCGLPIYHPFMVTHLSTGFWIEAKEPNLNRLPAIQLVSKQVVQNDIYRYTLELNGTKQNEILIKAMPDTKLIGWSFNTTDIPVFDKEEYFVHFRYGKPDVSIKQFSLDLKGATSNKPAVVVAVVGHYHVGENTPTDELKNIMKEFPEWTHLQAVEASYVSWQF